MSEREHRVWPCYELCAENLTGLSRQHCVICGFAIIPPLGAKGEKGPPWRHANGGLNRHEETSDDPERSRSIL